MNYTAHFDCDENAAFALELKRSIRYNSSRLRAGEYVNIDDNIRKLGELCANALVVEKKDGRTLREPIVWTKFVCRLAEETGEPIWNYPSPADGPLFLVQRKGGQVEILELIEDSGNQSNYYFDGLIEEEVYAWAPLPQGMWPQEIEDYKQNNG